MKKILFVTDAWAPQANGVVRVLESLIPLLKKGGYEILVIEPSQFTTVALPFYKEIPLALFSRRRIRKKVQEFQPDAVCLVTEGPLGWAARSVCVKRKIPFISWYHTNLQSYAQMYSNAPARVMLHLVNFLLKRFHAKSVVTMVSTESLKRELEAMGFQNLVIMPLGVTVEFFARAAAARALDFPKPIFAYIGRVAIEKSPEEFLRLDLPGTKVVLGSGPLLNELKEKYPDVHFLGRYAHDQHFVEQLSCVDVFVCPSRTETFGLVVLEALACGVPVAAHDVMGPRDVITSGVDGFLGEDLREAALACLSLSRESCREKAEKFSWEHSADTLIEHLERSA